MSAYPLDWLPRRTYAVSWLEAGQRYAGQLRLGRTLLQLDGHAAGAGDARRSVALDDIVGLELQRAHGRRELVLGLRDGSSLALAILDGPGAVSELHDELRRDHERSTE